MKKCASVNALVRYPLTEPHLSQRLSRKPRAWLAEAGAADLHKRAVGLCDTKQLLKFDTAMLAAALLRRCASGLKGGATGAAIAEAQVCA